MSQLILVDRRLGTIASLFFFFYLFFLFFFLL
jgi:hypothetical protein